MIDLLGVLTGRRMEDFSRDPTSNFWFTDVIGGRRTESGVPVTNDVAMTYSAVWCATMRRVGTLAMLPKNLYRKIDDRRKEIARDNPVQHLLHTSPNPEMNAATFWSLAEEWRLNGGNFVAEIQWDNTNRIRVPYALWPIHPSRVKTIRDAERTLFYEVKNDNDEPTYLRQEDVVHFPSIFTRDGIWGRGTVQNARESIGFGIATERHGARTFGSGAMPKVVVTHPKSMTPDQRQNFRKEWKEIHTDGGFDVAILSEGADAKPLTLSVKDQQFLEVRQHNVEEIARWYDLPPHTLHHLLRATFSNIEHLSIEMVKYSFMPWIVPNEQELLRKLIPDEAERSKYFVKYEVAGLLRGDSAARAAMYHAGINDGWLKPDEARELEDLDYEEDADQLFIQGAMVPLDKIGEDPAEQVAGMNSETDDSQETEQNDSGAVIAELSRQAAALDSTRNTLKATARGLFSATLARMVYIEITAAKRASKKPQQFLGWLDEFYGEHQGTMSDALSPVFTACVPFGVKDDPKQWSAAVCEQSRTRLLDLTGDCTPDSLADSVSALMGEWEASRAAEIVAGIAELN